MMPRMPDTTGKPVEVPDPEAPPPGTTPAVRPFCRTTGYLFQTVGAVLALGTCCLWPAAHWWQGYLQPAPGKIPDPMIDASAAQQWAMFGISVSFLGGLGLIVTGLGLQHDRLRTGRWPMWLTGAGALFHWTYLGFCVSDFATPWRVTLLAVLGLVWTALFVLSGVSADELRRHPPTPSERGWTSIDADDLQALTSLRQRDKKTP